MNQIQKKQLEILSKSKPIQFKSETKPSDLFRSYVLLRTEQRANHRKEIKQQEKQQKDEFDRLYQSAKKDDIPIRFFKKRRSQSQGFLNKVCVKFETPVGNKTHRKFQKTPFPKLEQQ